MTFVELAPYATWLLVRAARNQMSPLPLRGRHMADTGSHAGRGIATVSAVDSFFFCNLFGILDYFCFVQAYKLSAYQVKTLRRNQNATPSTLGVLYFLLVIEGQGAHPRVSGVRKQVWVCSVDWETMASGCPSERGWAPRQVGWVCRGSVHHMLGGVYSP